MYQDQKLGSMWLDKIRTVILRVLQHWFMEPCNWQLLYRPRTAGQGGWTTSDLILPCSPPNLRPDPWHLPIRDIPNHRNKAYQFTVLNLILLCCRLRSSSYDGGFFKPVSQVTVSLKEESSDDSTIISSQTSTLTRNQVQYHLLKKTWTLTTNKYHLVTDLNPHQKQATYYLCSAREGNVFRRVCPSAGGGGWGLLVGIPPSPHTRQDLAGGGVYPDQVTQPPLPLPRLGLVQHGKDGGLWYCLVMLMEGCLVSLIILRPRVCPVGQK